MKFDGYVTLYVNTAGMLHVYLNRPPNTLYLRVHVKPAPPSWCHPAFFEALFRAVVQLVISVLWAHCAGASFQAEAKHDSIVQYVVQAIQMFCYWKQYVSLYGVVFLI